MTKQEFIDDFIAKAPGPGISRQTASRLTGYQIAVGSLANRDSQGTGCADRIRVGRRTGYITRSFAAWFAGEVEGLTD